MRVGDDDRKPVVTGRDAAVAREHGADLFQRLLDNPAAGLDTRQRRALGVAAELDAARVFNPLDLVVKLCVVPLTVPY